ncbi:MAG TPA: formate--tetrahydrofolate ligase [Candidatus Omnitrophota bacterium]|nr:formate--tetrahydrofolate ligase [Candidatus Omnitrophota bacterium]HPT06753.1 formate--tetrahydrofolate ligase [Candidatus Omnitrophota bacterium]
MRSDVSIAQSIKKNSIKKVAAKLSIAAKYLFGYGDYIAKIDLDILSRCKGRKQGKYILVTAMTPTPLGEGKTVTTIGLAMSLNRLGKRASVCIRQPSMGPVFGIKGSAGGGGYSQVLPREDFDLHFTGDAHAVSLAHNIAAAFLDNALYRGNLLGIDENRIYWRRIVDIGDRALRNVRIGLGSSKDGIPRESGFDITPASEIMAILALASDMKDLRRRLGRIVLASDTHGNSVTTEDVKVAGLMSVLLKDAIKPNLIQTIEGTPCFVHTGPFANIAHGSSSIIQDTIALAFSDYVVTEAGFGAECGAEKFFDIKCRISGLKPDCAVIVCSLRALKAHAGICSIVAGKPLETCLRVKNMSALEKGIVNLAKQIENVKQFGIPAVVAINKFSSDTKEEIEFVRKKAFQFGADDCQVSEVWAKGSRGGVALAKSVAGLAESKKKFSFLYPLESSIREKIETIAGRMYGAAGVTYSPEAEMKIEEYTRRGWSRLPVCMAKTPLSLSHDASLKGRPSGFIVPVRDIRAYAGAGFLTALCGSIQTMPGLPSHPRGENIDIDSFGTIRGLS